MVKSATARVVEESAKLDLDVWLRGGKPRTKTVKLSNNPDLVDAMNAVAAEMNEIADRINDHEAPESGGIADDDSLAGLTAQWQALKDEHDELSGLYGDSIMEFVFRSQRPSDPETIAQMVEDAGLANTTESQGLALVALTCVSPALTIESLKALLDAIGGDAFLPMAEAVGALARKQEKPAAPLSLRP